MNLIYVIVSYGRVQMLQRMNVQVVSGPLGKIKRVTNTVLTGNLNLNTAIVCIYYVLYRNRVICNLKKFLLQV